MKAFIVKNLWDYEQINPVPEGLNDIDTFYITDSEENQIEAENKGWDCAVNISQFLHEMDKLKRRSIIGFINSYPDKIIEFLKYYDKIFVCDSNIIKLPSNYMEYVNSCGDQACYLTSGYYKGDADNIQQELSRSVNGRWGYNNEGMIRATGDYIQQMFDRDIDYRKVSVSSAKYIGWNLKNPKREEISNYVSREYEKHLQGNLIFTYVSAVWKNDVFNFRDLDNFIIFSNHKYVA